MLLSSVRTSTLLLALLSSSPAQSQSLVPVNKGLVAFGLLPASARDSTGTTIGGIGSAIAIKRGSFSKLTNGSYVGSLIVQPDRGYNVDGTVDFQGRQHELAFTLNPYNGTPNLTFAEAQQTLFLSYKRTLLYTERLGKHTTGLDALDVRPRNILDPPLPIPSLNRTNRLSLDCEGLVLNADGTFWVGDEYGAYIYKFFPNGNLEFVIQPPQAVLPYIGGKLNFTSSVNPDTGRAPNQGFEGLTASPDGKMLYAMLQSATIQDGGNGTTTTRYARMFQYDVSKLVPKLKSEWVVPLPLTSKGKTNAQSEIHYLDGVKFLVLARDGHGHGDDTTLSAYKSVDIFDITSATNIAGSTYDGLTPVSPGGVLSSTVTPATYTPFVSLIDGVQLGRFGLHNGGASDSTLIDAKWESLALTPVDDPQYPNDYFLFVGSDNDFITLSGAMAGQPYSASFGQDVDNQFMVYRVTLPMVPTGSVAQAIAGFNF